MKKGLSNLIPNSLVKKYSFRPPNPPQYTFEFRDGKYQFYPIIKGVKKQIFSYYLLIDSYILKNDQLYVPLIHISGLQNAKSEKSQSKECLLNLKSFQQETEKQPQRYRTLIIFSHANASDLGDVYFLLKEQALNMGQISLHTIILVMEQVLDNIKLAKSKRMRICKVLNYSLNQIILWGFSLGSGPATEIATRFGGLAGLILQAPIASIYNWFGEGDYGEQDIYVNYKKIQYVRSNILIIHGDSDKIVGHEQSERLYNKYLQYNARGKIQFALVKGAGHNDLQFHIEKGDNQLGVQIHNMLRQKGVGFNEKEYTLLNLCYVKEHVPGQYMYQYNSLKKFTSSDEIQRKKADGLFFLCTCD